MTAARILFAVLLFGSLTACSMDKLGPPPGAPRKTGDQSRKTKETPAQQKPTPEAMSPTPENVTPAEKPEPTTLSGKIAAGQFGSPEAAQALPIELKRPGRGTERKFYDLAQAAVTLGAQKFYLALLADSKWIYEVDADGNRLFHHLAAQDLVEIAQGLVDQGLTNGISALNNAHQLPLHQAKSPQMVKVLWSYRDAAVQDQDGQTPLIHMAVSGHEDAARWAAHKICKEAWAPTSFFAADPLNAKDKFERTALHYAVIKNQIELVDTLTACSTTDLSPSDRWQRTPLHYAAQDTASPLATQYLVDRIGLFRKASFVNVTDTNGDTPLHLARACGNSGAFDYLKPDPAVRTDIVNHNGETALQVRSGKCPRTDP